MRGPAGQAESHGRVTENRVPMTAPLTFNLAVTPAHWTFCLPAPTVREVLLPEHDLRLPVLFDAVLRARNSSAHRYQ